MKKYNFILIIFLILLVSACGNSNSRPPEDVKLQSGTEGLELGFLDKQTLEITEDSTAYLPFELKNAGFQDIGQAVLIVSLEQDYLDIDSWKLPERARQYKKNIIILENLKGKSLSSPVGEKQTLSAVLKSKGIDSSRNSIESRAVLNLCYPYSTVLSETICIDTDPHNENIAQKTCTAKDISFSNGQGAPVAITKIEQKIIPTRSQDKVSIQFTIFAENMEDGLVINRTRYDQVCLGEGITKEDYNTIELKSIRFSDYRYEEGEYSEIECSPNPMKETKEDYYTVCTLKEENAIPKSMFTFETPLVIELSYGYKTTEAKKIDILNRIQEIG